jgi:hypothetical protein
MMCNTVNNQLEELELLINKDRNNERECGKSLKPLARYLKHGGRFLFCKEEFTHSDGRTDLIITESSGVGETERNYAYVWELKSPKKALFTLRKDTKRFDPTKDLIQAESQLIQYIYHLRKAGELERYNINNKDDVKLGGIIIGTIKSFCEKESIVREKFDNEYDFQWSLYEQCVGSRRSLLYDPIGLKLLTWDEVVKDIKSWLGEDDANGVIK